MLDDFYRLNERFYNLYGRLYENSEFLTKRQTDAISSRLLKQYEIEFKKLDYEKMIIDKKILFRIKTERGYFAPFKFLFFKNKLAKLISKEIKDSAKNYYDNYFENLRQEQANETSDVEDGDNSETSSKNLELDNNEGPGKDSEAGESEEKSLLSET